jgi:Tfp pilus assembly protein PilO
MKITQKTIWASAVMLCVIFAVFILFVYNPSKRQLQACKAEYSNIRDEMDRIEKTIAPGENIDDVMDRCYKKYKGLSARFPSQEETVLEQLSSMAKDLGINLDSVRPDRKSVYLKDGVPVVIDGLHCDELQITVNFTSDYISFGKYLEAMRRDFPYLLTVQSMAMHATADQPPKISAALGVKIYLLESENK